MAFGHSSQIPEKTARQPIRLSCGSAFQRSDIFRTGAGQDQRRASTLLSGFASQSQLNSAADVERESRKPRRRIVVLIKQILDSRIELQITA